MDPFSPHLCIDGKMSEDEAIADIPKFLELKKTTPSCGKLTATSLSNPHESKHGAPYPKYPPPYETPHNIFRSVKKLPGQIIPKMFALTHLDEVMREMLLATISLDGPGREKLVEELGTLSEMLKPSIDKIMGTFGKSMKSVLMAVPGLNIVYAISDLTEAFKEGNEAGGEITGTLNDFIDKVDGIYKRSAGSNRLVSSLFYGLMEFLDETGQPGLKKAAVKNVGKRIMGPAGVVPMDPDITAAVTSRAFSNKVMRDGLLSMLSKAEESDAVVGDPQVKSLLKNLKTALNANEDSPLPDNVFAGEQQEIRGPKGTGKLHLLQSFYKGLKDKYDKRSKKTM